MTLACALPQVNVQAIKFGTKFVETLIKLLPLWEPYFAANQEALTAILTEEVRAPGI